MEKQADTAYPIHELLQRRWSPRAFSDKMVETDKLQNRLEKFGRASGNLPRRLCIKVYGIGPLIGDE